MEPNDSYRYYYTMRSCAGRAQAGIVPGLILVAIGALFFLNNLHIVYLREWFAYWPAILIALGIVKLVDSADSGGRTGGAVLAGVGAVLLARNLGFIDVQIRDLWPLALIAVGLMLLFQRAFPWPELGAGWRNVESNGGSLHADAVFGGGKRRIVSQDFKGGKVSAVFGGFELDLRGAEIAGDSAVLHIDAVFGGVEVKIPQHWSAEVRGTGVFGGYSDESFHPDETKVPNIKRLILKGGAVFGGVVVKN